ncbi:hypothetical protein [Microbacterium gilvum]|uniref:O-antigen ligase family protein n=1 Tax=Microbacterium gilvum TaxID=1336204 RepID=A0ABP9ABP7_9MICO
MSIAEATGRGRPPRPPSARLARRERSRRRRDDAGWALAILVAGVASAAGVVGVPVVAVPVIAGVLGVFVAIRWPFAIAFTTLAVLAMSSILEITLGAAGSAVDDVLVLVCAVVFTARRMVTDRAVVFPPGIAWFAGFALAGAASAVILAVPTSIWTQQAFLSIKGVILALAFAQLEWTRRHLHGLIVAGALLTAFLALCGFLNLVATEAWVGFTRIRAPITVFGIPALNGPYAQPAAFGRITAVIGVGALCLMLVSRRRLAPGIVFVLASTMSVLTVTVKSLTSMMAVYGVLFVLRVRSIAAFLLLIAVVPLFAVVAAPVLVDLISNDLTAYFFNTDTESARSLLASGALEIAQEHFPLGAGFGRYGTFIASSEYSPEYLERGWEWHYGLGREEEWGRYLTDTQWPAILGETGWLGAILFAGGLAAMTLSMVRPIGPLEPPLFTWIRWAGISWIGLITIESIAAPVYSSPPAYAFAFLGSAIVAALRYEHRRHGSVFAVDDYVEAPDSLRETVRAGR